MVIQELTGKNFSNYDLFEYEVGKGVTLIEGKNLSGKSSLLDLIRFAAYGNCKKAKKIEYFRKRGVTKPLETRIKFEYKGKVWEIERKYDGKSDAKLSIDGDTKAKGVKNVELYLQDNFVAELLLCNSNLVQQGDNSGLVQIRPTERFNLCKRIFGLDRLKVKSELVKVDMDREDGELRQLRIEWELVENDISELEKWFDNNNKDNITSFIAENTESLKTNEDAKNKLLQERGKVEQEIATAKEKNEEIQKHNDNKEELIRNIETLEISTTNSHDNILRLERECKELTEVISSKGKELEEEVKQAEDITLVRLRIVEDKPELRDTLVEVQANIKKAESDLELVKMGKCPTCSKPVDHMSGESVKSILKTYRDEETSTKKEIAQLEEAQTAYAKAQEEQQELKDKKLGFESTANTLKVEIKGKEELIKKNQELIESNNKTLSKEKSQLEELRKQLEDFKVKPLIDVSDLESQVVGIVQRISGTDSEIQTYTGALNTAKLDLLEYEKKEKELTGLKCDIKDKAKAIKDKDKLLNNLKEVRNIFEKKLPLFMVIHKLNYISKEANSFLHKTFGKYDISFEQEKDALSIIFTDTVTNLPSAFENLSGFEAGVGGLAIRMGFSMYNSIINQDAINWIGLDEVDAYFEEENSELLFKNIVELQSQFQQVVMITHNPVIKEWIQPQDTLLVKNDGKNSYALKD